MVLTRLWTCLQHIKPQFSFGAYADHFDRLAGVTAMVAGHERLEGLPAQHLSVRKRPEIFRRPISALARNLIHAEIRPAHPNPLRPLFQNFDKAVRLPPSEVIEQFCPAIVAFKKLEA